MTLPKHKRSTTVVGSYPQPDWLVDRQMLSKSVPRTRMMQMWRIPDAYLEQAQDDATIAADPRHGARWYRHQDRGEIAQESYSNRFATALEGIDAENPAMITSRSGQQTPVPRVVGAIKRTGPVELRDMEFLRRNTGHAAKITLPGPFTMSQQAKNEYYKDDEELAMAMAGRPSTPRRWRWKRPGPRRDPARRTLGAQRSGIRQALCRQGHQPRAAGRQGADRGPCLLRLCRRGARRHQAGRLFVPRTSSTTPPPSRISIEGRSPGSTSACSRSYRRRRSCSA